MNILIDGQVLMTPEVQRGIGIYFIKVLENMIKNNYGFYFWWVFGIIGIWNPAVYPKLCVVMCFYRK